MVLPLCALILAVINGFNGNASRGRKLDLIKKHSAGACPNLLLSYFMEIVTRVSSYYGLSIWCGVGVAEY